MRTRKEILEDQGDLRNDPLGLSLEVLLDIRDLLANPGVQNDYGIAHNILSTEEANK